MGFCVLLRLVLALCLVGPLLAGTASHAQDVPGKPNEGLIAFGLSEQAEVWSNLRGGRRTGVTANGLMTLSVHADLGGLAGLDGWYLYGSVFQIHGRGITQDLVGNLQVVSNIEATRSTKLYNLWVTKTFMDDRLELRIGQEGANDEMMISQQAQLFLNSSFGYPALLATNLPSGGPNYPIAAPMARFVYKISDAFSWQGAIFDGDPAGPGTGDPQLRNRYGVAFRLRDAPLIFNELWFRPEGWSKENLPGLWKLGVWYHDGDFPDQRFDQSGGKLAVTGGSALQHKGNHAFYAVADQLVWRRPGSEDQGLGLWALAMVSPSDRNLIDLYVEGGMTFKGLFESRPKDKLGLAFAYMRTSMGARSYYLDGLAASTGLTAIEPYELVTELTYQYVHSNQVSIQPSLQHIRNPGAALPLSANRYSQVPLKDAFVAGVRAILSY